MGEAKRRKVAGTYPNQDAPPAVTSWDAGPTQLHLIELMLDDPRLMRRMPLWQRVIGVAVGTGRLFVPADTVISIVGDIRAPDAVDSLSEDLVMQAAHRLYRRSVDGSHRTRPGHADRPADSLNGVIRGPPIISPGRRDMSSAWVRIGGVRLSAARSGRPHARLRIGTR